MHNHTYVIRTYIHTCIHNTLYSLKYEILRTYIHTYIHTYTGVLPPVPWNLSNPAQREAYENESSDIR